MTKAPDVSYPKSLINLAFSFELQVEPSTYMALSFLILQMQMLEKDLQAYFLTQYDLPGFPSMKKRVKLWLTSDKPMGTGDLMRSELVVRYGAEQFWVSSYDGCRIDCLLIRGSAPQGVDQDQVPTIIFCNPNACYYEYLPYQTEWVDFYYNLGINLVIWNYRSYGRSQSGHISPTAIMKDGEKVFQYVKS